MIKTTIIGYFQSSRTCRQTQSFRRAPLVGSLIAGRPTRIQNASAHSHPHPHPVRVQVQHPIAETWACISILMSQQPPTVIPNIKHPRELPLSMRRMLQQTRYTQSMRSVMTFPGPTLALHTPHKVKFSELLRLWEHLTQILELRFGKVGNLCQCRKAPLPLATGTGWLGTVV